MIEIKPAGLEDNNQLLELLYRCPRGTRLVVRQERYGDFFKRSQHYALARTFAAWDEDRIVGTLECALKPVHLGGTSVQGGYLFGLSVDPEYRRLGIASRLLDACESYLKEQGADFAYCSVLDDNYPSLGLLGRSGYEERARLQQMVLVTARQRPAEPGVRRMKHEDWDEVAALLNRTYRDYDMYLPFTGDSLGDHLRSLPGLDPEQDVYVVEQHGEITACLGCWQISSVVSSEILQWDRRLETLTRLAGLLRKWVRVPHIPQIGETYRHCAVYPLAFRHSVRELGPLWNALHNHVHRRDLGSLTVSFSSTGHEHALRDAGFTIRGGSSRILMKVFTSVALDNQKPVFVSPLE